MQRNLQSWCLHLVMACRSICGACQKYCIGLTSLRVCGARKLNLALCNVLYTDQLLQRPCCALQGRVLDG